MVESPGSTISSGAMRMGAADQRIANANFSPAAVPKKAHETPDGMGGFLKSLPENTVSEVSGSLESEFGSKHLKTN